MSRPEEAGWKPLLSLRIIVGKIFIGVAAVGSGFSLGREGPTVQVGASLLNALHRLLPGGLHIPRTHMLVAGGAAGIAAAFNTPLAGIAFAIETLTRNVESRMSGLIITAIVLAGIVSQAFLGKASYFGQIAIAGSDREMALAVAITALVCGVSGGLFSRMLIISSTSWTGRLADLRRAHPVRFAAACGVLVAALGYVTGGISFGSGYSETRALLEGRQHARVVLRSGQVPRHAAGLPERIARRHLRAQPCHRCGHRSRPRTADRSAGFARHAARAVHGRFSGCGDAGAHHVLHHRDGNGRWIFGRDRSDGRVAAVVGGVADFQPAALSDGGPVHARAPCRPSAESKASIA
jgi:hypothetical protein